MPLNLSKVFDDDSQNTHKTASSKRKAPAKKAPAKKAPKAKAAKTKPPKAAPEPAELEAQPAKTQPAKTQSARATSSAGGFSDGLELDDAPRARKRAAKPERAAKPKRAAKPERAAKPKRAARPEPEDVSDGFGAGLDDDSAEEAAPRSRAKRAPKAKAKPERAAKPKRAAKPEPEDVSDGFGAGLDDDSAEESALTSDAKSAKGGGKRAKKRRKKEEAARREEEASAEREALREDPEEDSEEGAEPGSGFLDFGLSDAVLDGIADMGWVEPSEIQQKVIPLALTGVDVVGQARTGTGKTGAFSIPVIERFAARGARAQTGRSPVVLILSPTRELAYQIHQQITSLSKKLKLKSVSVYGGAPMEPQLRALRSGCDVIVGTPGRVMDHIRRGSLKVDEVECFVLDEADRMFDLGFRDDIYWVCRRLPKDGRRQTLLLSATIADEILQLSKEVTRNPKLIRTAPTDLTVTTVEQFHVPVDSERKLPLLVRLVLDEDPEKGIVFTRTKRGADRVAQNLRKQGIDAGEIHSDLRQKQRERILERFREGNLHMMIATDVAARGLDIQGVTHIFNYDVPENAEDYVHRVGRTARMGRTGRAFTFVTPEDGRWLTGIEKLINKMVPSYEIEGFRTEANEDERKRSDARRGFHNKPHPMSSKFSPGLMAILQGQQRRAKGKRVPRKGRP